MRTLLLFSCLLAATIETSAQAPAQAKPAPAPSSNAPSQAPPQKTNTAAPAPAPAPTAAPATKRPAAAPALTARGGAAITATSPKGVTLSGVHVEFTGPTDREGETDGSGQLNVPNLLVGTYRVRFSGDKVTTFEREVTVRVGQVVDVDVSLNPAQEPRVVRVPAAASPQGPAPAPVGPRGQLITLAIVELLEKEFVRGQPRRESLLSCSGSERATMIQLNEPLPDRLYESADAVYYVLGGEGTIQVDGKDMKLVTNGFASVPRGTPHSFSRRGTRSLVLLAVLSGEPCEQVR